MPFTVVHRAGSGGGMASLDILAAGEYDMSVGTSPRLSDYRYAVDMADGGDSGLGFGRH
jgi:hypothetical protein